MRIGPDAARYLHAAQGGRVPKPFWWRSWLPRIVGDDIDVWRRLWLVSWPVLAAAMVAWRLAAGDGWQTAAAASVMLLALPGILGPAVSIPVQLDLPSTALAVVAMAFLESPHPAHIVAGVAVCALATSIRESVFLVVAVTVWTPWALLGVSGWIVAVWLGRDRRGPDPLGPKFQTIADHPVRTALEAHRGMWRNGWVMVAPWGITLVALYDVDIRVVVVLVLAYAQLLVATDTVRLVQHVAGPAMAAAAAATIPVVWLPLAVVVHVMWWRTPERI